MKKTSASGAGPEVNIDPKRGSVSSYDQDSHLETKSIVRADFENEDQDQEAAEHLEKLFRNIQEGDLEMIRFKLKGGERDDGKENILSKMCHPLCDCEKCSQLLEEAYSQSKPKTVKVADPIHLSKM